MVDTVRRPDRTEALHRRRDAVRDDGVVGLWLETNLAQRFDKILHEAIPVELLAFLRGSTTEPSVSDAAPCVDPPTPAR